jgi:hypothetical protein
VIKSNALSNYFGLVLPITTQMLNQKPNTSTLKPLISSRVAVCDEQINAMTGTTSSSSNQATSRSIRPVGQQQQIKSKTTTPLGYYANPEQMRTHVNRSVLERQHPTNFPSPPHRRGLIQQIIPFDASPSKVNNLLLRHHNQPTIIFHPSKKRILFIEILILRIAEELLSFILLIYLS